MFYLIRVAFLTVVNAYRPVIGRPQALSRLVVVPVLMATLAVTIVVPFAQNMILATIEQLMQVTSVFDRLVVRAMVFAAEMLTLVPWLWLASVLMMNWPQLRHSSAPPQGSLSMILQGRVWKSTALMTVACALVALALASLVQTIDYLSVVSGGVRGEAKGRLINVIPFMSLVLLSRYGMVIHGLSIGKHISIRRGRQLLRGHSWRLFWTILMVIGAAHLVSWPVASDRGWGSGPMHLSSADASGAATSRLLTVDTPIFRFSPIGDPILLPNADAAGVATSAAFMVEMTYLFDLFMFALAFCAISEVLSRLYSATGARVGEPQDKLALAPA